MLLALDFALVGQQFLLLFGEQIFGVAAVGTVGNVIAHSI